MEINAKRVQRLWRQEGLRVPRRQRKRQRPGSSEGGTQRLRAERVNHVWGYGCVFDQTEDGRRLKWLPICDEFSRELGGAGSRAADGSAGRDPHPGRGCDPARECAGIHPQRQRPRVRGAGRAGVDSRGAGSRRSTSSPAARGRMPAAKASSCRFRDEFLNREAFASVLEAKVLGRQHRHRHNHERPHSSPDYQTPVEFAQRSLAAASATLRQPQGCTPSPEYQTNNQTPGPNQKLS